MNDNYGWGFRSTTVGDRQWAMASSMVGHSVIEQKEDDDVRCDVRGATMGCQQQLAQSVAGTVNGGGRNGGGAGNAVFLCLRFWMFWRELRKNRKERKLMGSARFGGKG